MIRPGPIVLAVGQCFETERDLDTVTQTLSRDGINLFRASDQHSASLWICEADPAVVVIDLSLTRGSPLAVADFCNYRRPEARVILLGGGRLLTDGALFRHVGNAAAIVPDHSPVADVMALIAFHAGHRMALA